jgi:hypothetical protein
MLTPAGREYLADQEFERLTNEALAPDDGFHLGGAKNVVQIFLRRISEESAASVFFYDAMLYLVN